MFITEISNLIAIEQKQKSQQQNSNIPDQFLFKVCFFFVFSFPLKLNKIQILKQ